MHDAPLRVGRDGRAARDRAHLVRVRVRVGLRLRLRLRVCVRDS